MTDAVAVAREVEVLLGPRLSALERVVAQLAKTGGCCCPHHGRHHAANAATASESRQHSLGDEVAPVVSSGSRAAGPLDEQQPRQKRQEVDEGLTSSNYLRDSVTGAAGGSESLSASAHRVPSMIVRPASVASADDTDDGTTVAAAAAAVDHVSTLQQRVAELERVNASLAADRAKLWDHLEILEARARATTAATSGHVTSGLAPSHGPPLPAIVPQLSHASPGTIAAMMPPATSSASGHGGPHVPPSPILASGGSQRFGPPSALGTPTEPNCAPFVPSDGAAPPTGANLARTYGETIKFGWILHQQQRGDTTGHHPTHVTPIPAQGRSQSVASASSSGVMSVGPSAPHPSSLSRAVPTPLAAGMESRLESSPSAQVNAVASTGALFPSSAPVGVVPIGAMQHPLRPSPSSVFAGSTLHAHPAQGRMTTTLEQARAQRKLSIQQATRGTASTSPYAHAVSSGGGVSPASHLEIGALHPFHSAPSPSNPDTPLSSVAGGPPYHRSGTPCESPADVGSPSSAAAAKVPSGGSRLPSPPPAIT